MNSKEMMAVGCAGLMLFEAVEFGITGGERQPLPAGQPHTHNHAPTGNMSASHFALMGSVATSTASASTSFHPLMPHAPSDLI